MKKNKHEKIFKEGVDKWWNSLNIEKQKEYKLHYEKIRLENFNSKHPFPDMVHTSDTRISKLTNHQKFSIWRFKDHKK